MTQNNWRIRYKSELAYFKALRQFVDTRRFGLEDATGAPFHVNSRENPFPNWHRSATCRSERRLGHRDARNHLEGVCALFIVNSPVNRVHEIAIDIDGLPGSGGSEAVAAAHAVSSHLFQSNSYTPFVESSRHGRGSYLRFLIHRSSKPEEFNRKLNDLGDVLRDDLGPTLEMMGVRICGIKGSVWYRFKNPQFDPALFQKVGRDYLKEKRRYVWEFHPDEKLEEWTYFRGSLITAACYGVYRPDTLDAVRYMRWIEWATHVRGDRKLVLNEEWLRGHLRERPRRLTPPSDVEALPVNKKPLNCIPRIAESRCDRGNAWERALYCWFGLCRLLHRQPTLDEFSADYLNRRMNTGEDVRNRRLRRFRYIMGHYPYDPVRDQPKGFIRQKEKLVALIDGLTTPESRNGVKYKCKIDSLDLAIGLALVERNCFGVNDDPDWQYTCGNEAFHGWFEKLYDEAVTDRRCSEDKSRAIKTILMNMGLIVCLDPKWRKGGQFGGARYKGISKKFGVGPAHPRFGDFQRVLRVNPPLLRPGAVARWMFEAAA